MCQMSLHAEFQLLIMFVPNVLFICFIYFILKPPIGEHKHKTKNMTYNNKITPQITQT